MKKRFIASVLAFVLILGAVPAMAAADGGKAAADTLYSMQLFLGTGTDAEGKPVYELERSPSRAEAIIMLIRLLGREDEAAQCAAVHPFTDVPSWAQPYVAFAYNEGLTSGVSSTAFGTKQAATANMYLTFVLRALGYSDTGEGAQFSYTNADEYAREVGVADIDYGDEPFLRGAAAEVSLNALSLPLYASQATLIETLVETGAVDAAAAVKAGFSVGSPPPDGEKVAVPVTLAANGQNVYLDLADLKAAFPAAATLVRPGFSGTASSWQHISAYKGISADELFLRDAMYNAIYAQNSAEIADASEPVAIMASAESLYNATYYVLNRSNNVIAVSDGANASSARAMEFTRRHIDTQAMQRDLRDTLSRAMANYNSAAVTIDTSLGYHPFEEPSGSFMAYPIYVNGAELAADQYLLKRSLSASVFTGLSETEIYSYIRYCVYQVLYCPADYYYGSDGQMHDLIFTDHGTRQLYSDGAGSHYGAWLDLTSSLVDIIVVIDAAGSAMGYTIVR